jgi:hypothetical protein
LAANVGQHRSQRGAHEGVALPARVESAAEVRPPLRLSDVEHDANANAPELERGGKHLGLVGFRHQRRHQVGRKAAHDCGEAAVSIPSNQGGRDERPVCPASGEVGTESGYGVAVEETEAAAVSGLDLLPLPGGQPRGEPERVL